MLSIGKLVIMIELRPVTRVLLASVMELLKNANDTNLSIERVADEKCFGKGVSGQPNVTGAFEGSTLLGVAVDCGSAIRLIAVDWQHRRRTIGTMLLTAIVTGMQKAGRSSCLLASEAGNYFTPGVPQSMPAAVAFAEKSGFRSLTETVNLRAPLTSNPRLEEAPAAVEGVSVERASNPEALLAFVESTFGSIWRFEVSRALEATPPTVFVAMRGNEIAGFSAHEANNRGLGTFGPTGVHPSARGRGIGRRLLLESLRDLRELGYESAIIPWTDSIEFYERSCGAVVEETYVLMRRNLAGA